MSDATTTTCIYCEGTIDAHHERCPLRPGWSTPTDDITRGVKAWAKLSPHQQALHLVFDHGFDADWFNTGPIEWLDDEDVVRSFETGADLERLADGHSYPSRFNRDTWHDSDHAEVEYRYGGADGLLHEHEEG